MIKNKRRLAIESKKKIEIHVEVTPQMRKVLNHNSRIALLESQELDNKFMKQDHFLENNDGEQEDLGEEDIVDDD